MATILDEIKQKKSKTFSKITAKVPSELKDMIDYITAESEIDKNEYISAILEKSEIRKVYNSMRRDRKKTLDDNITDSHSREKYEQ